MKPQEALQLLDQAVAQVSATRASHVQLQTAVNVLGNAISDAESDVDTED